MKEIQARAISLSIEIRLQGMIAENKQREALCQSMVYSEESFIGLNDELYSLLEGVIKMESP